MTRRGVLTGSAAVVATLALGACAGSDDSTPTAGGSAAESTPESAPASESVAESESAPASESAAEPGSGPTGEPLATTGEFPAGGGKVVNTDAGVVVVTQPADGEFKAFNGKCPHQGCPVTEVVENTIICQCHGSVFDADTGDRLEGPAPVGLQEVPITVEGDSIYLV